MQVEARERYRRIFLAHLDEQSAKDPTKRQRLFDTIRDRLVELAQADPSVDIEKEIDALSLEYNQMCVAPDAYMATGGAINREAQAPEPRVATDDSQSSVNVAQMQPTTLVKPRTVMWPSLAAMTLATVALLVSIESQTCGWIVARCSDSGWIRADTVRNHTLKVPHNLGSVPSRLQIWFSADADGALTYPTEFGFGPAQSGNPVTVSVNANEIGFHIYQDVPLRGVFNAETGKWTNYTTGYLRFVVSR
ncbi:MAG: hypothetical protein ACRCUE_16085 [Bosea sp. (in: a-proteobacteria)]